MSRIAKRLLYWYKRHGRILPWRGHPNPYAVWVSEIMLQQTRVEAVIPYFARWMARFPTIQSLAEASEQDVLNHWEGLGYYTRARNLHKAAKIVAGEFGGKLPHSVDALRKLPGIGRYTAGAIASMVFGMDEPTLDGNLRRVFARLFNVKAPADSAEGEKQLWSIAAENLPKGRAGDFSQALMDLGATICLPKNPLCMLCPLEVDCQARKLGIQEALPILKPKAEVPSVVHSAAVIIQRGRVMLAKRPSEGLLGGMWEFPNGRITGDPAWGLHRALKTGYSLTVRAGVLLGILQHAYTHFRITVHVFSAELKISGTEKTKAERMKKNIKWVKLSELEDHPMGKIDRQIARKYTSRQTP